MLTGLIILTRAAARAGRIACRIEMGELGSVKSNLEGHARQDHMVRITRGNSCQARMPQRLSHVPLSFRGMPRYHLGACLATTEHALLPTPAPQLQTSIALHLHVPGPAA